MKFANTHVIALANHKGGCGKTTSCVGLGAALAHSGCSVAIVDLDPQCNATDYFGIDREAHAREGRYTVGDAILAKRPARDIEYDFGDRFENRLTVIPGHRGLGTAERRLESELQTYLASGSHSDLDADELKNEHRLRLRQSLETLRGAHDVVLIDTPPELGFLMTSALIAADWFIIPVFPSGFDLQGLQALLRVVDRVKERYNPRLYLFGVLLGNSDPRAKLDADIRNRLVSDFGQHQVFQTAIHRSVKHREATVHNRTIIEHAAGTLPAEQFVSLSRELITRIERIEAHEAQMRLREVNRA